MTLQLFLHAGQSPLSTLSLFVRFQSVSDPEAAIQFHLFTVRTTMDGHRRISLTERLGHPISPFIISFCLGVMTGWKYKRFSGEEIVDLLRFEYYVCKDLIRFS